ncbi:MAG: thiamine phosphate synthase [Desulfuromonadaceae bacterium]|nr:thiamine phosphate synthase [Desulfuromonadaceae bacterium]
MPAIRADFSLYLISDRHQLPAGQSLEQVIEAALDGGVGAVQLREKDLPTDALYELACRLRRLTRAYGARLLINDRIDIALAAGADGVHLTEQSLPVAIARQLLGEQRLIGVSTHALQRASEVAEQGADFITFSPIYATPSKAAYGAPQGLDRLREVCDRVRVPVLALGGINAERAHEVRTAGAHGIALISAILCARDPAAAARAFLA